MKMRVTYTAQITARCPVKPVTDVYWLIIESEKAIPVEEILLAVETAKEVGPIMQEELTLRIARELGVPPLVKTEGQHSGVMTTVEVIDGEVFE